MADPPLRYFILPMIRSLTTIATALLCTLNCMAQKEITYKTTTDGTLSARSVGGLRPMADGEHYTTLRDGVIARFRYRDGAVVDTLFDASAHNPMLKVADYTLSEDESKILIPTQREKIYRHSSRSENWVYDHAKRSLTPLSVNGKQQEATLSPDGRRAAFVRGNDLYVVDLERGTEAAITSDGEQGRILNGIPDWVYEEEYSFSRAYEWAPDSRSIAYYRFDESRVRSYDMNTFKGELYPQNYSFKYPKAGEENSLVEILIYNLDKGQSQSVEIGPETDIYIPRIEWVETKESPKLAIHHLNRLQNDYHILLANADGKTTAIYHEQNPRYVQRVDNQTATFLPNERGFIIKSEQDGWMHLYHYDMQGQQVAQITNGEWEVTDLAAVDNHAGKIHYHSTERSPLGRDLYVVGMGGRGKELLSTRRGTNRAVFSRSTAKRGPQYYINYYSSSERPTQVTLHRSNGRMVRTLEDNATLQASLDKMVLPQKEFFTFTTPQGVELNGWMLKPTDFDPNKRYPILMTQYSGPGSQRVQDNWSWSWEAALLREGFVVVCVDPRGTGFRGEEFRKCTYGRLGEVETEDQISAARYLGTLPWVDPSRIAIYGWSYGGFMALNCILKGGDVFSVAVAVAPVTSWRYYDTIYTELYNGLPQQNPEGYDNNSPINFADSLRGKLLIAHGTGDDNVHIQNTYEMISRLGAASRPFNMMIYPDQDHSMGSSRDHLIEHIIDYLKAEMIPAK